MIRLWSLFMLCGSLLCWGACTSVPSADPTGDSDPSGRKDDLPLHEVKVFTRKPDSRIHSYEKMCTLGSEPIILDCGDPWNRIESFRFGSELCENPIIDLQLVAPHLYRATCFQKHLDVDFRKAADVEAFIDFNRSLPGFTMFYRQYQRTCKGEWGRTSTTCTLQLEYPDSTTAHCAEISRWLTAWVNAQSDWMDETDDRVHFEPYSGSPTDTVALATRLQQIYFATTDSLYSTEEYKLDLRAYTFNERFITYQMYNYSYGGGMHGAYSERLISYDFNTGQPITPEYLFRPDCLDKVRFVLMMTVAEDDHYRRWNTVERLDDVISRFIWDPDAFWGDSVDDFEADEDEAEAEDVPSVRPKLPGKQLGTINISCMGLTPEGVVISFSPYEVDCYAAGCYHFFIPYWKIHAYLSDEGKRCVTP